MDWALKTPLPPAKKVECGLGNGFQRMLPESNEQRVSSIRYQDSKKEINQKKFTLKLSDARKLFNTGNGDIDAIMQKYSDISSCKNVHDTMIKIVQTAKWAFRVHYGEMNIRGFVGQ